LASGRARRGRAGPAQVIAMTLWDWIGLALCAGLFVYLLAAMLRPELFD
jgi:K+-transporting ATPase KdpF subunit